MSGQAKRIVERYLGPKDFLDCCGINLELTQEESDSYSYKNTKAKTAYHDDKLLTIYKNFFGEDFSKMISRDSDSEGSRRKRFLSPESDNRHSLIKKDAKNIWAKTTSDVLDTLVCTIRAYRQTFLSNDLNRPGYNNLNYIHILENINSPERKIKLPAGAAKTLENASEISDNLGNEYVILILLLASLFQNFYDNEWEKDKPTIAEKINTYLAEKEKSRPIDIDQMQPSARDADQKSLQDLADFFTAGQNRNYWTYLEKSYENKISLDKVLPFNTLFDPDAYHLAVLKLKDSLLQLVVDYFKCDYILNGLWRCRNQAVSGKYYDSDLLTMISSGITIQYHLGNTEKAFDYYQEYKNLDTPVHILEIGSISNRIANIFENHYDFEKAIEITLNNISRLEKLKEVLRRIAESEITNVPVSDSLKDLGRAYSLAGSLYSVTGDEKSLEYYKKALDEFGDDLGNRSITICHILHFSIEYEDGSGRGKKLFEKYAGEYLEDSDLLAPDDPINIRLRIRYRNAMNKMIQSGGKQPYPLWIVMKSIAAFYNDEADEMLRDQIRKDALAHCYDCIGKKPLNLLYRYAAQIFHADKAEPDMVKGLLLHSLTCLPDHQIDPEKPLDMIMLINYHTKWIFLDYFDAAKEKQELLQALLAHAEKSGWDQLSRVLRETGDMSHILRFENC